MVTHYILISSSYTLGKRIAMHRVLEGDGKDEVGDLFANILFECGDDVSVSTHLIETDSKEWNSVVQKDKFFDNIKLIQSVDEFIKLIKDDRKLIGLDVAKYILKKINCTHLKLQKLTYFCYADYLCKTGERLFEDKIFAYQLGPVVKSVYDKYKRQGIIKREDNRTDCNDTTSELSMQSRILFAYDGAKKMKSIDETIERYKDLEANALVDLTHKPNTPWSMSGCGKFFDRIISDETIKKYHEYETI